MQANPESTDAEWRRLRDVYAAMSDGELETLAAERGDLTRVAQQALDALVKERGIVPPASAPQTEDDQPGDNRSGALFSDNVYLEDVMGEADAGWLVVLGSALVVQIRKAAAVLEAHSIPFRLKSEPSQRGPAARTSEMGRMYLSVEEDNRAEAEEWLRKETDLYAQHETIDDAYLTPENSESDSEAHGVSVGMFQERADIEAAEKALREAGISFTASREEIEEDMAAGTPASEALNVQVSFEDYERAINALEKVFSAMQP